MPSAHIVRSTPIVRTVRVQQVEGLFDVPVSERSDLSWDVNLPLSERPWKIGLIVGPSGCGKSTIARDVFGSAVITGYEWPSQQAIVDGFAREISVRDVTLALSSVGFSSPPSWLRPFGVLSTGEQFRATVARALLDVERDLIVLDEFTSVVDRTVAQIGSAAVARSIRQSSKQFVAVTCHYDVEAWLQPDWVYQPHSNVFHWRELQRRPDIQLELRRCASSLWGTFRRHHYLSSSLLGMSRCFVGTVQGRPATFTAVVPLVGSRKANLWREHRTVCLPDFQGVGLGSAASAAVGGIVCAATHGRYRSTSSHPAFVRSRNRSALWLRMSAPSMSQRHQRDILRHKASRASTRLMSTHEYVGPVWRDETTARALWEEIPPEGVTGDRA